MSDFNKKVGKFIEKDKADHMIKNWKKQGIKTDSSFIGSDIINTILGWDNVVGLRIHYAMDDEGNMQPIFRPQYADGTSAAATTSTTNDTGGADSSIPCPPFCS